MIPENRIPTHPGEVLLEEFLKPLEISQSALADKLHIPIQRINEIVNGKRGITPETAWLFAGRIRHDPGVLDEPQGAHDWRGHAPKSTPPGSRDRVSDRAGNGGADRSPGDETAATAGRGRDLRRRLADARPVCEARELAAARANKAEQDGQGIATAGVDDAAIHGVSS